jgi:hypothetical protein
MHYAAPIRLNAGRNASPSEITCHGRTGVAFSWSPVVILNFFTGTTYCSTGKEIEALIFNALLSNQKM